MDVFKLAYGSQEIECLSDFVILCFTVRCFRDSGGGKDVLPLASDLLTYAVSMGGAETPVAVAGMVSHKAQDGDFNSQCV
ncbi:unnamed protein product [Sphagnum troendelagicum]